MEAIRIDMSEYEYAGEGANGMSYNHRTDPSVMLKMYKPGMVQQPLDEMMVARRVFEAGIASPEPGDYVTDGERFGIRFRRIMDKVSFARAVGDHPERAEEYAVRFARMCLALHSTVVDRTVFESIKDRYYRLLEENPFFSGAEKEQLSRFIAAVPDADTAIHGDLQFGNAIMADGKEYFIDLGDFCYGNPLFDVGMVYLTCRLNDEAFTREAFHMDNATAGRFWEAFAPAYFGADRPLSSIEEEIRPFAGLKTLIVERDTKRPMLEFRAALTPLLI